MPEKAICPTVATKAHLAFAIKASLWDCCPTVSTVKNPLADRSKTMLTRHYHIMTAAALVAGLATIPDTAVQAYGGGGSGYGGGGYGGRGDFGFDVKAASYINGDAGANAYVDPNSSCFRPDQDDMQRFSDRGTTNRNVHNDACFLDRGNNKVDGPASFDSRGVGFIFACPDPDGAGPKVAILSDRNGDGRKELCFQSGYQQTGAAGDLEFHARMNNTGQPGTQNVTWCSDRDRNGCSDESIKDSIRIDWSADGKTSFSRR